ncbi:TIGR02452 family protein [Paenibacillus sp. PK3_47]|uniref:TIGR02452 family protein n=1 Tax=Paenibacillus sp. PK3_47 TaxID=2072642 RepID=UPI00201DF126|nr:TIGR02452 family protein [Paenibacillus sp. PK3_47]UQZ36614.1 TIGR02452 family protein [Paenibacillus sp. PK3_47]
MNYKSNARESRAATAQQTLDIIAKGSYRNSAGHQIDIAEAVSRAVTGSQLYSPEQLTKLNKDIRERIAGQPQNKAKIEVTGETTLEAAQRLVEKKSISHTVCLNFASAKNPGGGFLNGSQAQEESLARASALYPCISQMSEMYKYNRSRSTALYSHYMIHSPEVPVFRGSREELLTTPYNVSMITAPAVNAGVVKEREADAESRIAEVMLERIRYILSVAADQGHPAIVLGAFGCGVFRNDPSEVAGYFRKVLLEEGYQVLFDTIVFAILDRSPDQSVISAFRRKLL